MNFPPSQRRINDWELEPVDTHKLHANKRSLQQPMFRHNPTRSQAETTVNSHIALRLKAHSLPK